MINIILILVSPVRALDQPETPLPLPDLPSPNKEVCLHLARPGLGSIQKIIFFYFAIVRAPGR